MKKIFTDGKLNKHDEGELKIAIYIEQGRLIIDFQKELSWIGFDKRSLRLFINGLENKYIQL
jgi:hypothetical protein